MIDKLAEHTANVIAKGVKKQRFFQKVADNASKVSVSTSNAVNFVARPVTIMATTKQKHILDGAYNASSSIASGISETLTGATILKPFNKAVEKSTNQLKDGGFFKSVGEKSGIDEEKARSTYANALGRILLLALVPINGIAKMLIHPPLSHATKDVTEKIKKKKKRGLNIVG